MNNEVIMDSLDRLIINGLQGGFPICERPYLEVAKRLNMSEEILIERLAQFLEKGLLSRFGPLYHAERLGGALTLAAMSVPETEFDHVTGIVNAFPEVAHNYARDHELNMWFVLATEQPERVTEVLQKIEAQTGLTVYNMPKQTEYYVGLRLEV